MHATPIDTRDRQRARGRARGEYQGCIAKFAAVGERDSGASQIHRCDRRSQFQRYVLVAPESLRSQEQTFGRLRCAQEFLRQRGPLIGQVRLCADDHHRALEAALAQADRHLGRALSAADDHGGVAHWHRYCSRSRQRDNVLWLSLAGQSSVTHLSPEAAEAAATLTTPTRKMVNGPGGSIRERVFELAAIVCT